MVIVGIWYIWEKKRDERYDREDRDLERGSEDMEKEIMATMRKRTMSKHSTWEANTKRGDVVIALTKKAE